MRVFPVFAAALLLSFTPAMAKSTAPQPKAPLEQSGPEASPSEEMRRNILNDIMDRMMTDETGQAPNPFKNPGPRLISDGWAQRV